MILSETKMGGGAFQGKTFQTKHTNTQEPLDVNNSIDASSETIHMTEDTLEGVANSRGFKLSPVAGAMLCTSDHPYQL